ncbi:hypothetical protein MY10362_004914 [Beauveria mimosiformis]
MTSASDAPMPVPLAGQVINVILSLAATNVLTHFMTQRLLVIKVWRRLPFVAWLVFAIYIDSYCFVFATAMLQHAFGVNRNVIICRGAILLCLVCYVTTKFIYLFLVEKAYVVRGAVKRRLRSKLYIFNSFVLFSAIVIQWVTSNDNAGTSISSSLGVCHGNGIDGFHGRPAVVLRDQNRACHNFSPYLLGAASTSPPTPVEFPLKTTTHCCSQGAEYDVESCDSLSMTAAKMLAPEKKRSVVLVTTTIERDITAIGSLQPPPSSNQPSARDRSSYVDVELATTAAATSGEGERDIKGFVPWTAYSLRGRSSS